MKFFIVIFGLILLAVKAQESCRTPHQRLGGCINIKNCAPLMEVLRRPKPLPESDLDFLKNSQCGYENLIPKVCCPLEVLIQMQTTPSFEVTTSSSLPPNPPDVTRHRNLRLLDHELCGPITQARIVGGNKTGVLDFPWMALIAFKINGKTDFRCGGSIINKRYVLTAAHCVTNLPTNLSLTGVRVGDHDLRTERDCDRDADGLEGTCAERYQDFGIQKVHYHSEYTKAKLQNDIALLRLDDNIDFRPTNARPICLPIGSANRISQKKVTVTGWGAVSEFGPRSQDLLKVNISPVPTDECAETYRTNAEIWYKQLCAGGVNGMDSCIGDSGGPLQSPGIYNNNARFIQHGIVSFGPKSCGTEGFPGVYTRVSYYTDWILDQMTD